MTAKKVKAEENLNPVEETTETTETPEVKDEVAPTPVEETPAEEPTPTEAEETANEEVPAEPAEPVEPTPVEPEPVEETTETTEEKDEEKTDENDDTTENKGICTDNVFTEYKQISTITAPEEIKKIIEFYGVTSKDLCDGNIEKMWLKDEELVALKTWYATLA